MAGPGGPFKKKGLMVCVGLNEKVETMTGGTSTTPVEGTRSKSLVFSADLIMEEQPSLHLTGSALAVLWQQEVWAFS